LHEVGEEAFDVTILRPLPHHRLVAYEVATEARVFTIARAEACEAAAALEIAAIAGDCTSAAAYDAHNLAHRLVRLLTGLIRPKSHPSIDTKPNPELQPDAETLDPNLKLEPET
jgi:hypothetical protein